MKFIVAFVMFFLIATLPVQSVNAEILSGEIFFSDGTSKQFKNSIEWRFIGRAFDKSWGRKY